jgi:ABC-2 type transport system ATP-binding protein
VIARASPTPIAPPAIEARDLTRRFGTFLAVDRVSLRVPAGSILALLGPNGAGKTTIVRMLAGLVRPTAGDAVVAGRDVRTDPAGVRARVGLVTDVPGLHEQMAPAAYLDFFGRLYGLDAATRRRRIADLLAFFGLEDVRGKRMAGFSKGMKQKVALARALLHEPPVLFLDEPTSGLDPLGARAVRDLILTLRSDRRTVVLCTHDLDEAERLADDVAILRAGRIIATGTPGALRAGATAEVAVRIELASPCPTAAATLGDLEGIAAASTEDGPAGPGSVVTYRTAHPQTTNPRAIAHLVAAGAAVVTVSYERRSLEDAYAAAVEPDSSAGRGSVHERNGHGRTG